MGDVIYDGRRFSDFGVIVSGENTWAQPTRRVTKAQVPGMHGDLIVEAGEFNNVDISYPAGIMQNFDSYSDGWEQFEQFIARRSDAYYRLEDEYHPEYYRMARFNPGINPKVGTLNRSGQFTVTFDCKPQKYLLIGDVDHTITEAGVTIELANPTNYTAYPEIKLMPHVAVHFNIISDDVIAMISNYATILLNIDESDIPDEAYPGSAEFTYYTEQREVVMRYWNASRNRYESAYVTSKLSITNTYTLENMAGVNIPAGDGVYAEIQLETTEDSPEDITTIIKPRWYTI